MFIGDRSLGYWLEPLLRNNRPTRIYLGDGSSLSPDAFRGPVPRSIAVFVRRDSWTLGIPEARWLTEAFDLWRPEWALLIWLNNDLRAGTGPVLQFIEEFVTWSKDPTEEIGAQHVADLEVLAQIPSRRDPKPGKTRDIYTITREAGTIKCTCMGYVMSKRTPPSCRHTLVFDKLMSDEAIRPEAAAPLPEPQLIPERVIKRPILKVKPEPEAPVGIEVGSLWTSPGKYARANGPVRVRVTRIYGDNVYYRIVDEPSRKPLKLAIPNFLRNTRRLEPRELVLVGSVWRFRRNESIGYRVRVVDIKSGYVTFEAIDPVPAPYMQRNARPFAKFLERTTPIFAIDSDFPGNAPQVVSYTKAAPTQTPAAPAAAIDRVISFDD